MAVFKPGRNVVPDPEYLEVAVVLAGGTGSRFGNDLPKQLTVLGEHTILGHTLRSLSRGDSFDRFRIVANRAWFTEIEDVVIDALPSGIPYDMVEGGSSRNESVWNAILDFGHTSGACIIHDGVRPLVRPHLLASVRRSLRTASAVVPVIDAIDPLFHVENGLVEGVGDRSKIFRGQSPQGFDLQMLWQALSLLGREHMSNFDTLYEAVLAIYPGTEIHTVEGDPDNVKVTKSIDRLIVSSILGAEVS